LITAAKVIFLFVVYLLGAYHWSWFIHHGSPEILTWFDFTRFGFYAASMTRALRAWELPLYYPAGIDGEWVNFYWAHPDTPMLPTVLLFKWLPPEQVLWCWLQLFYAAGFIGVLHLARYLRLSVPVAALLALLLLGNGYLHSRWMSGQTDTISYFLLPWFWLAIAKLTAGDPIREKAMAVLMAVFLLSGGTHVTIWCWYALATAVIIQPIALFPVARVAAWFVLLVAIRIVPTLTVFPMAAVTNQAWMGGYSLKLIYAALFGGQSAIGQIQPFQWEYDAYIGWPALALTAVMLVLPGLTRFRLQVLVLASPFVLLMAGDNMTRVMTWGIPLLTGERCPTRMVIMPISLLFVYACVRLQMIKSYRPAIAGACLAMVAADWTWYSFTIRPTPSPGSVLNIAEPMIPSLPESKYWGVMPIMAINTSNHNTPGKRETTFNDIYRSSIAVGSLITLAALIMVLF
jgi:hypothetical protein